MVIQKWAASPIACLSPGTSQPNRHRITVEMYQSTLIVSSRAGSDTITNEGLAMPPRLLVEWWYFGEHLVIGWGPKLFTVDPTWCTIIGSQSTFPCSATRRATKCHSSNLPVLDFRLSERKLYCNWYSTNQLVVFCRFIIKTQFGSSCLPHVRCHTGHIGPGYHYVPGHPPSAVPTSHAAAAVVLLGRRLQTPIHIKCVYRCYSLCRVTS